MVMAFAAKKDTDYVRDDVFVANFMSDLSAEMGIAPPCGTTRSTGSPCTASSTRSAKPGPASLPRSAKPALPRARRLVRR